MLSASHLIIVFLVALLVFGPEKLPELARTVTKAMGEFRRLTGDFQDTLQREMRQLERDALEQGRSKSPAPQTEPALSFESPSSASSEAVFDNEEFDDDAPDSASAMSEGVPETEEAPPSDDLKKSSATDVTATTFEALRYDDSYHDAAMAKAFEAQQPPASSGPAPAESSEGAQAAEAPPAADSPEALNASLDEKSPASAGAEKPANDHPTAA
jgi:sec-independent protein translocase protein TatB